MVALGVLALLRVALLGLTFGDSDQLFVEHSVSNECLLRVQILVEVLTNDGVGVHTDSNLLEERVDVRIDSRLTTFLHDDEGTAAALNVVANVLKLVAREWQSRASQQEQICLLQLLLPNLSLVHRTL